MSSSDDFFGGGQPTLKFEAMGVVKGGPIVRVGDPMQQRDFATGAPKFWDKDQREPMMQLPIELQTDERDAEIPGDDGIRTLYVKGDLKRAIKEAMQKAGIRQGAPRVGGTLKVVWTAEEPSGKGNPKKLWAAQYTAPAGGDAFFGTPPSGSPAVPPAVPPASTPPVDPFASRGLPPGPQGLNPFGDIPPF